MRNFLLFCVAIISVAFALILIEYTCERSKCSSLQKETGVKTKYRLQSGCYVMPHDRWIPLSAWREAG